MNATHMGASDFRAEPLGLASGLLLFTPIVLVGNALGTWMRYPDIGAAVLFPPYAALAAALILTSPRTWGWYILIGAIAHLLTSSPHWPLSWVITADVANIVRALLAATLIRATFNGPPRLDSVEGLARFSVIAALIAPAAGATIGAANVVMHGGPATFWEAWLGWFMSNALTGLTCCPRSSSASSRCRDGVVGDRAVHALRRPLRSSRRSSSP